MSDLYYSTTNGKREGRASKFFQSTTSALLKVKAQNEKAEDMGLTTTYEMGTEDSSNVPAKEVPSS